MADARKARVDSFKAKGQARVDDFKAKGAARVDAAIGKQKAKVDEALAKRNAEIREKNRPKTEAWTAFQAATRDQHEDYKEAANAEGATKQQVQAAWALYREATAEAWHTYLTAIDAYSTPPKTGSRA